jgi:iron complex transport system permease protein
MGTEPLSRGRMAAALALGLVLLVFAALVAPLLGANPVDWAKAWRGEWPDAQILFDIRLPRVLLALLAGGALASGGVLFQALLRDALATPYTLGVSSGSSLGAVIAICFGLQGFAGLPGIWIAALIGAAAALALVMAIAGGGRRMSSFTLLLAGVTINSITMAFILLLHSTASFGQSFAITHWLMGGLGAVPYPALAGLAVIIVGIVVYLFLHAREWNLMTAGEDWAASRGVSPRRVLIIGYLAGSVLTATVTCITGPIGFVGLIVPHALRLKLGSDHRLLLPCSFLYGAAFLIGCDILARITLAPAEIPVGVVTALLGGPVFILLLRSTRRSLWL